MIEWLLKKIFAGIIREAVNKEIEYLLYCNSPKLDELKISYVRAGGKLTCWQALQNDPVEISLCITWIDDNGLEDFTSYRIVDLADLRNKLITFKPKFKYFNSLGLHVKPRGSSKSIVESLIRSSYDGHYSSDELNKAFVPLIKWIDERPELLI